MEMRSIIGWCAILALGYLFFLLLFGPGKLKTKKDDTDPDEQKSDSE